MISITVHLSTLLKKIQEITDDNMENVKLTICDKVVDQDKTFPAFLHFEAYTKDGLVKDCESIDSIMFYVPPTQSA